MSKIEDVIIDTVRNMLEVAIDDCDFAEDLIDAIDVEVLIEALFKDGEIREKLKRRVLDVIEEIEIEDIDDVVVDVLEADNIIKELLKSKVSQLIEKDFKNNNIVIRKYLKIDKIVSKIGFICWLISSLIGVIGVSIESSSMIETSLIFLIGLGYFSFVKKENINKGLLFKFFYGNI